MVSKNPQQEGTWESYSNLDMCGKGDKDLIYDWKNKHTLDELKEMVIENGYTAVTVSDGEPRFGHAAFKKFDFTLLKKHLKGIDTCCKHPCMIHIFRPKGWVETEEETPKAVDDTPAEVVVYDGTWESHSNLDMCSKGD